MFGFGDLKYEGDEEDDDSSEQYGLSVKLTDEEKLKEDDFLLCVFEGKVALGFGEGFLENFSLFGEIMLTGNEGSVDLCSLRQRKKVVAKLFHLKSVVFAMIDYHGVPRFLANQLVQKISQIVSSKKVVIFHSAIAAYSRSNQNCNEELFYLSTDSFPKSSLGKVRKLLPAPNTVAGPSAAFLTLCEMKKKPGLLLITYTETETIDSISLGPFFQAISPGSGVSDVAKEFSKFQHKIKKAVDINNLYA